MPKLVYNCETGDEEMVDLTPEEQAALDTHRAALLEEQAARDAELADNALVRQKLAQELAVRLTSAPGKTFGELTDREILHMVVRTLFGQMQNLGIFDANGVVQPLDQWKV